MSRCLEFDFFYFFLVAPSAALEVKTQKHNNEFLAVISCV